MVKYTLKREEGGVITYVYRTGFVVSVKPNYPQFLKDLVKYSRANVEDIETEEDLISLFDKAKNKGADFGKTSSSIDALKDAWVSDGNVFRKEGEVKQEFLERDVISKLKADKEVRITRKRIRRRIGRSKPLTFEEYTIVFKIFKD